LLYIILFKSYRYLESDKIWMVDIFVLTTLSVGQVW